MRVHLLDMAILLQLLVHIVTLGNAACVRVEWHVKRVIVAV